jgi:SprT-like protein
MDDEQLQAWVERVSLRDFGLPFRHRARFNGRLRSTGGRYFTRSHDIEISSRQLEAFGPEEVEKIIKHELCHYHLHLQRKGFRHRDQDFKELLRKVGGTRHCNSLPGVKRRTEPHRYKLVCTACRTEYLRKRKTDPRRYRCGVCHGRLKLVAIEPQHR